jgi:hypothetical protein
MFTFSTLDSLINWSPARRQFLHFTTSARRATQDFIWHGEQLKQATDIQINYFFTLFYTPSLPHLHHPPNLHAKMPSPLPHINQKHNDAIIRTSKAHIARPKRTHRTPKTDRNAQQK